MRKNHLTRDYPHPLTNALLAPAAIMLALSLTACQEHEADSTAVQPAAVVRDETHVEPLASEPAQAPGTLAAQIAEFKSAHQPSAEAAETADVELAKLREQGIPAKAIRAGQQAPDFKLANSAGEEFQLSKMLNQGPVVLVFFRGAW